MAQTCVKKYSYEPCLPKNLCTEAKQGALCPWKQDVFIYPIRDFFEMDSEIFWILKILVVVWRWLSMWWWSILPGKGGGVGRLIKHRSYFTTVE